jgi:hypothetical protein
VSVVAGGITSWLLSLGGTSCVVVFFLTLNALTAGAFDSIDIALLYLQVLSTIQGYSTWSNAVLDKLAQYVSIINFDLVPSPTRSFPVCFRIPVQASVLALAMARWREERKEPADDGGWG